MKSPFIFLLPGILLFTGTMACQLENNPAEQTATPKSGTADTVAADRTANRLRIRVGSRTFSATLLSNPTVTAFKSRLPLTLAMKELNGNEKFAELPGELPTNAASPGTIQAGDLMLYGSTTLVLFYEPLSTAYRYTRLGRIDNPSGLAAALGSGNVTVTLDLE